MSCRADKQVKILELLEPYEGLSLPDASDSSLRESRTSNSLEWTP